MSCPTVHSDTWSGAHLTHNSHQINYRKWEKLCWIANTSVLFWLTHHKQRHENQLFADFFHITSAFVRPVGSRGCSTEQSYVESYFPLMTVTTICRQKNFIGFYWPKVKNVNNRGSLLKEKGWGFISPIFYV